MHHLCTNVIIQIQNCDYNALHSNMLRGFILIQILQPKKKKFLFLNGNKQCKTTPIDRIHNILQMEKSFFLNYVSSFAVNKDSSKQVTLMVFAFHLFNLKAMSITS